MDGTLYFCNKGHSIFCMLEFTSNYRIFYFRNHYSIPLSPWDRMCRPGSVCVDCGGWSGSIHYAEAIMLGFSQDGSNIVDRNSVSVTFSRPCTCFSHRIDTGSGVNKIHIQLLNSIDIIYLLEILECKLTPCSGDAIRVISKVTLSWCHKTL